MSDYPEHDKQHLIVDKSQIIGEFLDWFGSSGMFVGEYYKDTPQPTNKRIEALLAEYFDIDLDKIYVGCFDDKTSAHNWARDNIDPTINPYMFIDLINPKDQKSLKVKQEEKSKILKDTPTKKE